MKNLHKEFKNFSKVDGKKYRTNRICMISHHITVKIALRLGLMEFVSQPLL